MGNDSQGFFRLNALIMGLLTILEPPVYKIFAIEMASEYNIINMRHNKTKFK